MTDLKQKQVEIEKRQLNEAKNIYKNLLIEQESKRNLDLTNEGMTIMKLGVEKVAIKVQEFFNSKTSTGATRIKNIIMFLSNSDIYSLSYLTLKSVLRANVAGDSLQYIAINIADTLLTNNAFYDLKETDYKLFKTLENKFKKLKGVQKNKLLSKELDNKQLAISEEDKVLIGSIMIEIVANSGADIIEIVNKKQKNKRGYSKVVKMTANAVDILLEIARLNMNNINNNMLPMIVEPRDWESFNGGGFLHNNLSIVKTRNKMTKDKYRQNFNKYKDKVDSLNKLQKVPWKLNNKILDVIHDIIENNMIDPNSNKFFPRFIGGLPITYEVKVDELIAGETFESMVDMVKTNKKILENMQSDKSRALGLLNTISIANEMIDYEKFYYVYQFDTRYRKYTNQQFLTPQGQDYAKAMLLRYEKKALTETGIRWMKIHIANVAGKDKLLLDDRVKWFDDNEDLILKIADNHFNHIDDWAYTDSPFEFLAGCFAWKEYCDTGVTDLAIQIDATCSGLQIFSGLMLDKKGAENVNVINKYDELGCPLRSDIYGIVAEEDNRMIRDGEYNNSVTLKRQDEDVNVSMSTVAKELNGKITRKIVKRNVMTLSYNATRRGMQDQLFDVVNDMNINNTKFWTVEDWKVVRLILDLNEKSMDKNIQGARKGQKFLNDLAKAKGDFLDFNTPFYNCPVYSTSYMRKVKRITTVFGQLSLSKTTKEIDLRKQVLSFSPNYIHSIDAELLDYVILNIDKNIGAIHDCFIIDPNDAEEVRNLFREGFIKIMETEPLKRLEEVNQETGVSIELVDDLDLNEVKKAEYILS